MSTEMSNTVRAEALALAPVSAAALLDRQTAESAILQTIDRHGGEAGCAAALAQEFGEHPELVCERMRWASSVVGLLYG
ncbi:hypothetical protein [Planomonospora venezuelensis]|uniref:Uncharacterized protein n=1 Tax=Planomonospora venezuelensis TaxID=1999 RepID=A0A841DJN8_PLAVE|nr:hypothetical protein [Planomonospora venezuelensis]MBB5967346.1 hypothetical protein [Planomonospora venezuelensis]GIN04736.1 hypothetical protein Pve01_63940 [Planomonospora venezuelensis]